MVASIGKGTRADYYLRRSEYYTAGREPAGIWLTSSSRLGLTVGRQVDPTLFANLHEGLDLEGKRLPSNDGGKPDRVSGYDLTLSAPKSVSMVYALADPETRAAIERAQLEASKAVIAMLDREAAFTRRGKNGVFIDKGSLIVAAFQHGEARPAMHSDGRVFADMDLHSHLCIANLSEATVPESDEIVFKALDGRALYAHKMAAGSYYHLTLATCLQRLGFHVKITGKNGIFDLVNPNGGPAIAEDIVKYFSARRNLIEDRLSEYDLVSGEAQQLAAAVAKATRLSKGETSRDRFELWAEAAFEQGLEVDSLVNRLRETDREFKQASELEIERRLADVPFHLTEHESVFERRALLAAVSSALVGTGVGPDRVEIELQRLTESGQVVQLGSDIYGHGQYSTSEMIAIERNLLSLAQTESRRSWPIADRKYIDEECNKRGLSEEQRTAVLGSTGPHALAIVSGAAGSGKTTALKLIVDSYRDKTIISAATAWRTARMLEEELNVPAFAIDSLLARIKAGQISLDRNTVLLIDECGQIGSRSMHDLLSVSAQAGAKVCLVGDSQQLQPISAGPAIKILTSVIEPNRIEKIVRQREQWARDASRCFAQGNAADGLALYADRGLLHAHKGAKPVIVAAVDRYFASQRSTPHQNHLLIAKSNKVVRALNGEIRKRMRADNALIGPEFNIKAGDASGKAFALSLAVGDRIRFGIRQDNVGKGVINGTVGRILQIDGREDGQLVIVADVEGTAISFSTDALKDKNGFVRITHDLAVTAYSSQGLTAETATVVLDASFDRHDSYVAMSRSRDDTAIFYDAELLAAKITANGELSAERQQPSAADQLAFLAQSISRANIKTSTLALTPEANSKLQRTVLLRKVDGNTRSL